MVIETFHKSKKEENKILRHIPYIFSVMTIAGAIVFAISGNTHLAGIFLLVSGFLYLTLTETILTTTHEIEDKYPQLAFVSRLIGGKTAQGMKFGGIVLMAVGVIWVFFI